VRDCVCEREEERMCMCARDHVCVRDVILPHIFTLLRTQTSASV